MLPHLTSYKISSHAEVQLNCQNRNTKQNSTLNPNILFLSPTGLSSACKSHNKMRNSQLKQKQTVVQKDSARQNICFQLTNFTEAEKKDCILFNLESLLGDFLGTALQSAQLKRP